MDLGMQGCMLTISAQRYLWDKQFDPGIVAMGSSPEKSGFQKHNNEENMDIGH